MGGTYFDLDALENAERTGARVDPASFMKRAPGGGAYLDLDAAEAQEEQGLSIYQRVSRGLDKVLSAPRAFTTDPLSEAVSARLLGKPGANARRGLWGEINAGEVGTDAIIPSQVGNDTSLASGAGHLLALSPLAPILYGNKLLGKAEQLALRAGVSEKVAGVPRALLRKGLGAQLQIATDPTSAVGAIAGVKGLAGKAVSGAERALAGLGAVAGGKNAVEAGGRVVEDVRKGDLVDAGLDLVDVATGAGMGYLGAKGATAPRPTGAAKGAERAAQYVEKNLEQIPDVGPELATKVRAFDNDTAVLSGQWSARMLKALDGLGVNKRRAAAIFSERIAPAIEGRAPLDALAPQELAVATEVRGLLDEVGGAAKDAGVLAEAEANYFPRLPKDMSAHDFYAKAAEAARREGITLEEALAKARSGSQVIASRAGRKVGALEQERGAGKVALQEGEYRTDPGVVLDYVQQAARRIAEARHFGKNGELAQVLIDRIADDGTHGYAQTAVDRIRGVEPRSKGAQEASALARQAQGFASLGLAPITQTTSIAQTAATAGLRPTAQAIFKTLWGAKDQPVVGVRSAAKRVARSWRQAKLDAMEAGALANSTGKDLADVFGLAAAENRGGLRGMLDDVARAQTLSGKVGAVTGRAPHLRLTQMMDEAQRVIAANTAQFLVPKLLAEAQGAGPLARARVRQLESLGLARDAQATPEVIAQAAKRISDKSQFRTGTSQLPLWATSPLGRAAFQFQSFGYQHTRFLAGLLDEAGHGNVAPLAKWAVVGAAAGALSNELKDLIKGHGYDKFTEDDWARNLADAVGKGRHVDPTKNPVLAAARGLAAAGGMGALGSLWERAQDAGAHPLPTLLGPTGGDIEQIGRAGADALAGVGQGALSVAQTLAGDEERAAAASREAGKHVGAAGKGAAKLALQQIPVIGGQLAQELADEKPARAGWVGKGRDALEDAGVLSVEDETARGAAGRARAAELKERQETTKDVKAQTEAQLEARPKASLEKRLENARKSGSRAEFENLIVDALAAGDMDTVAQLVAEARKAKHRFTRRNVAQLKARLRPAAVESEEEP